MTEMPPLYAQEKSTEFLAEQLSQLIRPLFKSFEENPLWQDSPYASFSTYMLANTMGKSLAQSASFDRLVQDMVGSLLKAQEKGTSHEPFLS